MGQVLTNLSDLLDLGNDAGGEDIANAGTVTAVAFVGDGTGLTGVGSGADKNYLHNQSSAATVWTVNHGLNKYPAVTVWSSAGDVVGADIHYVNANTITIIFTSAMGGKASCN